jgi:hypothetical protein
VGFVLLKRYSFKGSSLGFQLIQDSLDALNHLSLGGCVSLCSCYFGSSWVIRDSMSRGEGDSCDQ